MEQSPRLPPHLHCHKSKALNMLPSVSQLLPYDVSTDKSKVVRTHSLMPWALAAEQRPRQ
jgi:hypothetical protein